MEDEKTVPSSFPSHIHNQANEIPLRHIRFKQIPLTQKQEDDQVRQILLDAGTPHQTETASLSDLIATRDFLFRADILAPERGIQLSEHWEKAILHADSFFELLYKIIEELNKGKQGATLDTISRRVKLWQEHYISWSITWRKLQNDWLRLVKPALLYLACCPSSPIPKSPISGMYPFVKPPHFLTNLHHTKFWTGSDSLEMGETTRPQNSTTTRVSESRKQLYKFKHAGMEERCEQIILRWIGFSRLHPRMWTQEEVASFRSQEIERFAKPDRPYRYCLSCDGSLYQVVVPPLRGFDQEEVPKMRGPFLLAKTRPSMASLHRLVVDAVARLPSGAGTLEDICDSDEQESDYALCAYSFQYCKWVYLLRDVSESYFASAKTAKVKSFAPSNVPHIVVSFNDDLTPKKAKVLTQDERTELEDSYKSLWKTLGLNQELTKMPAAKYIALMSGDIQEMSDQVHLAVKTHSAKIGRPAPSVSKNKYSQNEVSSNDNNTKNSSNQDGALHCKKKSTGAAQQETGHDGGVSAGAAAAAEEPMRVVEDEVEADDYDYVDDDVDDDDDEYDSYQTGVTSD